MKQVGPELEFIRHQRFVEGRNRLLSQVDGAGEGQVAGARQMADSKEFGTWFKDQPDGVKALGRSDDPKHVAKLLKLFVADTGYRVSGGGGGGGKETRTDEEKKKRLGAAESTGGASGRQGGGEQRQPRRIDEAGAGEEIDEDDADAEFNRLAGERSGAKA
jgi:hypothetical protein